MRDLEIVRTSEAPAEAQKSATKLVQSPVRPAVIQVTLLLATLGTTAANMTATAKNW